MKTTNIRELKHDTSKVLTWVEQGHAVEITRRNHVVAILTPPPARDSADIKRPDFSARLKAIWGDRQLLTSWTDVIGDDRGNR